MQSNGPLYQVEIGGMSFCSSLDFGASWNGKFRNRSVLSGETGWDVWLGKVVLSFCPLGKYGKTVFRNPSTFPQQGGLGIAIPHSTR